MTGQIDNPVFIIGTERSGTNLVRLILNTHSDIHVPHPPHIMKNFKKIIKSYGSLESDKRISRLLDDILNVVSLHPYPWQTSINRSDISGYLKSKSLLSSALALYDCSLEKSGKKRWANKSTFMIHHVAGILEERPNAQFIYMARDCRDVLQSAKRSIFNHFHPYFVGKLWKEEQNKGLYWNEKLGKDRIHLLKYEDLLTDPEKAVSGLCDFLKISFDPRMLDFFSTPEAKKSASISKSWENTATPIMKNNFNLYKERLTKDETGLIEAIAFREMDRLGYKLENRLSALEMAEAVGLKPKMSYYIKNLLLKLSVEAKHFFRDKNKLLRMRKHLFLKWIKIRNAIC